jgi:hypothetical protein
MHEMNKIIVDRKAGFVVLSFALFASFAVNSSLLCRINLHKLPAEAAFDAKVAVRH